MFAVRLVQFRIGLLRNSPLAALIWLSSTLGTSASWCADVVPGIDLDRPLTAKTRVVSPYIVDFLFSSETIQPGHGLVLDVPDQYQNQIVDQVTLHHRQSPETDRSDVQNYRDRDETPGLTALLFYNPSLQSGERWRFWNGPSSGKWGAKFAEVRPQSAPEEELLYGFGYYGSSGLWHRDRVSLANVRSFAAINVGVDPIYLHRIRIQFLPDIPNESIEQIYSPNTSFAKFEWGYMKSFGGGEAHRGEYPYAWVLKTDGDHRVFQQSSNITATGRTIRVALPEGVSLSAVDVACGDAKGYKDGRYLQVGDVST